VLTCIGCPGAEYEAMAAGIGAVHELAVQRSGRANRRFVAAAMNHRMATDKAAKKGQPHPTDFYGALAGSL
jgi:hypothetical protein